jgi:hypothetical protein
MLAATNTGAGKITIDREAAGVERGVGRFRCLERKYVALTVGCRARPGRPNRAFRPFGVMVRIAPFLHVTKIQVFPEGNGDGTITGVSRAVQEQRAEPLSVLNRIEDDPAAERTVACAGM